jgi:hypothetical protein
VSHPAAPPPQHPDHSDDLDVDRGRFARWWWVPAGLAVLALLGWWMTHPSALPTGNGASAVARVDQAMAFGMRGEEGRTIHVRSVKVTWKGKPPGAEWTAYVCRDGAIGTSTDPEKWCRKLVKAEGATLDFGTDQLVISIAASRPQRLQVDDVLVSYREGIQWGTHPIGPELQLTVAE